VGNNSTVKFGFEHGALHGGCLRWGVSLGGMELGEKSGSFCRNIRLQSTNSNNKKAISV
jgi:hypothetical protein